MKRVPRSAPAPAVPEQPPIPDSVLRLIDEADAAYFRLVGFSTVLSRLAELHETNTHNNTSTVNFANDREDHFWYGVRKMVDAIGADGNLLREAFTALRTVRGGEHSPAERDLLTTYRQQDDTGRRSLEMWARFMDRLTIRQGGSR